MQLSELTSMKMGGDASEFHVPRDSSGFERLLGELRGRRPFILGGGCNTLFPDGRFDRPVVSTAKLKKVEIDGESVRAEAGVRLDLLIRQCIAAGLGGLEGLVGIPGTVGGATAMNAGGHGGSFGDRVAEVGLLPLDGGSLVRMPGREIPWRYRSWNLAGLAVGWVRLALVRADATELRKRARQLFLRKSRTQPLAHPSAGCVFKNPRGGSAGAMIESLGLKGERRGGAIISDRHANFILNERGDGSSADVVELIRFVRERVRESCGVWLETEIVFAGESPLDATSPAATESR